MENRRCKIFKIQCRDIMAILGNWKHYDGVSLPVLKGLPDNYVIRRVQYDFGWDAIALLVEHESFPEVAEGEMYPVAEGFVEYETVHLRAMLLVNPLPAATIPQPGDPYPEKSKQKGGWEFLGAP